MMRCPSLNFCYAAKSRLVLTCKRHAVLDVTWVLDSTCAQSVLLTRTLIHFTRAIGIRLINMRLSEAMLNQICIVQNAAVTINV